MGTKSGWRWWLYSHFSPFELFFLTHRLPSLATREPSSDTIGALILSGQQGRMECVSSNPVTLLIPQSPGSHQQIFHWCCVIQLSLILFWMWSGWPWDADDTGVRQTHDVPAPTSTEGKCVVAEQQNKVVEGEAWKCATSEAESTAASADSFC